MACPIPTLDSPVRCDCCQSCRIDVTQNLERPLHSVLKHFRPQVQGLNTEHRRLRFVRKVTENVRRNTKSGLHDLIISAPEYVCPIKSCPKPYYHIAQRLLGCAIGRQPLKCVCGTAGPSPKMSHRSASVSRLRHVASSTVPKTCVSRARPVHETIFAPSNSQCPLEIHMREDGTGNNSAQSEIQNRCLRPGP